MKKNELAKTLSEYIKEDINIKFDFSGEVISTYSVLCAEKLITNFNYNKLSSIREIYDYEKDDKIIVNTKRQLQMNIKILKNCLIGLNMLIQKI